ncbi:MAG: 5-formyltetrahydrofolate cyclo-ligase [Rhodocyclaceae bacterium]|nr:5-formyltetrahydrofolate cyclo-ligase [Rhodocyclaceae bacterium]
MSQELTSFRDDLRKGLISRREAMPREVHATASCALDGHLSALLARLSPRCLGFCWPYRGEFDARPLMTRLVAAGTRAALPVVTGTAAPMIFREWTPETPMVEAHYGIPIPAAGPHVVPDLILMPVNGFDAAGYRLGYGGGYFDRTLESLIPRPVAVGVGFELARVASIRPQPFDERLNYLVTEAGAFAVTDQGLRPIAFKADEARGG